MRQKRLYTGESVVHTQKKQLYLTSKYKTMRLKNGVYIQNKS